MVSVDSELRPGDVGAIVEQHGRLYRAEYQLDERFEAYVAAGVAAAVAVRAGAGTADEVNATAGCEDDRPDPPARFWLVREGDRLMGSAAVCSAPAGWGQFRWFLLEPSIRGQGIGAQLLDLAVEHSRAVGYRALFLWTFDALETAARLYRRAGFVETQRLPESARWGGHIVEVRYDLAAPFPGRVRRETDGRSRTSGSSPYSRRF
jgi:GNAT superfamily N-acetyltransferase